MKKEGIIYVIDKNNRGKGVSIDSLLKEKAVMKDIENVTKDIFVVGELISLSPLATLWVFFISEKIFGQNKKLFYRFFDQYDEDWTLTVYDTVPGFFQVQMEIGGASKVDMMKLIIPFEELDEGKDNYCAYTEKEYPKSRPAIDIDLTVPRRRRNLDEIYDRKGAPDD